METVRRTARRTLDRLHRGSRPSSGNVRVAQCWWTYKTRVRGRTQRTRVRISPEDERQSGRSLRPLRSGSFRDVPPNCGVKPDPSLFAAIALAYF
ncbi:hypothetical protein AArcMg_4102 (plasmid) [Natrarchaeobaculum sulfurireducens]|uniref:Uncharacterized protein n=1 Tax=Natrarchaeobaculum sulfurireducens TaxID=2044521 RepID=A0A346PK82_9EURY|nr:hypothetical protein AArcMg_4102 [Natrarchaeobaculum sulfurireducens]